MEIPISLRWRISKEALRKLPQKDDTWIFECEQFSEEKLPGLQYCIGVACSRENKKHQVGLYFVIEMEQQMNINVNCKLAIPSAGYVNQKSCDTKKRAISIGDFICKFDEFFNPSKKFFINDFMVVTMEAVLSVKRIDEADDIIVLDRQVPECCELGLRLWHRNDKDYTFMVDGKEVKVHKFVVGAASPVFDKLIMAEESKNNKFLTINFDHYETVETAVKFCYGFKDANLLDIESAINLLVFSDKYGITDLKTVAETFVSSKISSLNVCEISNASILSHSLNLQEKCFEFLLECNRKKAAVPNLDILDKDFAVELMKASFFRAAVPNTS